MIRAASKEDTNRRSSPTAADVAREEGPRELAKREPQMASYGVRRRGPRASELAVNNRWRGAPRGGLARPKKVCGCSGKAPHYGFSKDQSKLKSNLNYPESSMKLNLNNK